MWIRNCEACLYCYVFISSVLTVCYHEHDDALQYAVKRIVLLVRSMFTAYSVDTEYYMMMFGHISKQTRRPEARVFRQGATVEFGGIRGRSNGRGVPILTHLGGLGIVVMCSPAGSRADFFCIKIQVKIMLLLLTVFDVLQVQNWQIAIYSQQRVSYVNSDSLSDTVISSLKCSLDVACHEKQRDLKSPMTVPVALLSIIF